MIAISKFGSTSIINEHDTDIISHVGFRLNSYHKNAKSPKQPKYTFSLFTNDAPIKPRNTAINTKVHLYSNNT